MAYERGADGLSFFNFVYYRDHAVAPTREPPFQVLARMTNREWLAEQSQDYFLAQGCYYSQLPVQAPSTRWVGRRAACRLPCLTRSRRRRRLPPTTPLRQLSLAEPCGSWYNQLRDGTAAIGVCQET